MTTQSYIVRANKGRARIWLEGKRLTAAGFAVGSRFNIEVIEGALVLRLDASGSRRVSAMISATKMPGIPTKKKV